MLIKFRNADIFYPKNGMISNAAPTIKITYNPTRTTVCSHIEKLELFEIKYLI